MMVDHEPSECFVKFDLQGVETMAELVEVVVSDLLLDEENPRLGQKQNSQQDVYIELGKMLGTKVVVLADDIIKNGLDPMNLIAIIPTKDQNMRYKVIEGNRRVLALKALDTPSILEQCLSSKDQRRLRTLSARFHEKPIDTIQARLFDNPQEVDHWIELRHTGLNDGAGLFEWNSNEKDRFAARHSGSRSPAGQVIDFVLQYGSLEPELQNSGRKILTNIERLLSSRSVREKLGIEIIGGQIVSYYPASELVNGLSHVVESFLSGTSNVHDVYHAANREKFAENIPNSMVPRNERLESPTLLSELAAGRITPIVATPKPRHHRNPVERTVVIPSSCMLNIPPPRINRIYNELKTLNIETYPNAGAILLRLFLELSITHSLQSNGELSNEYKSTDPLSKKMKVLAGHLHVRGQINDQSKKAIELVANNDRNMIQASTVTFNQYVHNSHVNPTPSDIRTGWDTLQPFLETIWA